MCSQGTSTTRLPSHTLLFKGETTYVKLTVNHFNVSDSVAFSSSTISCSQHLYLILRDFWHLRRKAQTR